MAPASHHWPAHAVKHSIWHRRDSSDQHIPLLTFFPFFFLLLVSLLTEHSLTPSKAVSSWIVHIAASVAKQVSYTWCILFACTCINLGYHMYLCFVCCSHSVKVSQSDRQASRRMYRNDDVNDVLLMIRHLTGVYEFEIIPSLWTECFYSLLRLLLLLSLTDRLTGWLINYACIRVFIVYVSCMWCIYINLCLNNRY